MRIIVASMVKNEADRFWRSALEAWSEFADILALVDDDSSDHTVDIATDVFGVMECRVSLFQPEHEAWGDEANARHLLWDFALGQANPGDILFFLDADMVPARDPRELFEHSTADVFAFALYDLWEQVDCYRCAVLRQECQCDDPDLQLRYRSDRFWKAHLFPRVWAVRVSNDFADREWEWSERGIHSGHCPLDLATSQTRVAFAPQDFSLLHYGYITEEIRREKAERYASVSDQLTTEELQHAASITDSDPHLEALPFVPLYTLSRNDNASNIWK